MEDTRSKKQCCDGYKEEFHDSPDDFPFDDCDDCFSERIELNDGVPDKKPVAENATVLAVNLRRRRSVSHLKSELSQPSSSVCLDNNYLNSRKRKSSLPCKSKNKLENESSDTTLQELKYGSESVRDVVMGDNGEEEKEESSTLTNTDLGNVVENSNLRGDLIRNELDLRENTEADSGLLLTLAGFMIKAIDFQIDLLVKCLSFPVWLSYYLFMLVFNLLGLFKCCRGHVLKVLKRTWNLLCENVSPLVNEWLKENKAFWKMGLKFGWGILWAAYVCTVLVTILVSAFVIGGLVLRLAVEEPLRMQSNLNFDYTEKSLVVYVPVTAYPGVSQSIHLGDKPEPGKASGLRVIPPKS